MDLVKKYLKKTTFNLDYSPPSLLLESHHVVNQMPSFYDVKIPNPNAAIITRNDGIS
jgi:hypothetical protein